MHEQRPMHEHRQQQSSSSADPDAPVITDEGVESEESDSRRSAYSSESTMSSSFSSSTSSSETRGEGRVTQQQQQQQTQQEPRSRRRPVAIRDGEITGGSSIPSTAIVRRRPLHQTLGESSDDNFEVAISWLRSKRILLGRLVETLPHGKLSMVCSQ